MLTKNSISMGSKSKNIFMLYIYILNKFHEKRDEKIFAEQFEERCHAVVCKGTLGENIRITSIG